MMNDYIKQLDDLFKLKESKEISEAEYEVKKAQILAAVTEDEKKKTILNEKKQKSVSDRKGCFMWIMIIICGSVFVSICSSPKNNNTSSSYSATDAKPTDDNSTVLYKAYLRAERALKKSLHDADSYEEVSNDKYFVDQSKKKNKGKYIQIKIQYRAKNGFGANRLNTSYFTFDKDLNIIEAF